MNLLTIASLTLREAARRRVLAAVAILTVVAIGLTAWGLSKLAETMRAHGNTTTEVAGTFAMLTLVLGYMFSVVLGVGASFIAAPSIASDAESGVLLSILPRPIRRSDVVLGKWLALVLLVGGFAFVAGALELLVLHAISGYSPPHPFIGLAFLAAESIVLLTLALCLGTRLPPIAAGITAVVAFGLAWIGGITQSIALALQNTSVLHATTLLSLILPTDAMWRSAAYAFEPAIMAAAALADTHSQAPFAVASPPPAAFEWWTLAWVLAVLSVAIVSFNRREL
jgi:ABC-type transport system involved in multi-copper enzyme maturation permease subunit